MHATLFQKLGDKVRKSEQRCVENRSRSFSSDAASVFLHTKKNHVSNEKDSNINFSVGLYVDLNAAASSKQTNIYTVNDT